MKTSTFVIAGLLGITSLVTPAAGKSTDSAELIRISDETGVPVRRLEGQRAWTGFGYGELETANLLASASGKSFFGIVQMRRSGRGWGKIAHDLDLNLGRVVSDAHRSDQAALHAQNGRDKNARLDKEHGRPAKNLKKANGPNGGRGHGHGHGGH